MRPAAGVGGNGGTHGCGQAGGGRVAARVGTGLALGPATPVVVQPRCGAPGSGRCGANPTQRCGPARPTGGSDGLDADLLRPGRNGVVANHAGPDRAPADYPVAPRLGRQGPDPGRGRDGRSAGSADGGCPGARPSCGGGTGAVTTTSSCRWPTAGDPGDEGQTVPLGCSPSCRSSCWYRAASRAASGAEGGLVRRPRPRPLPGPSRRPPPRVGPPTTRPTPPRRGGPSGRPVGAGGVLLAEQMGDEPAGEVLDPTPHEAHHRLDAFPAAPGQGLTPDQLEGGPSPIGPAGPVGRLVHNRRDGRPVDHEHGRVEVIAALLAGVGQGPLREGAPQDRRVRVHALGAGRPVGVGRDGHGDLFHREGSADRQGQDDQQSANRLATDRDFGPSTPSGPRTRIITDGAGSSTGAAGCVGPVVGPAGGQGEPSDLGQGGHAGGGEGDGGPDQRPGGEPGARRRRIQMATTIARTSRAPMTRRMSAQGLPWPEWSRRARWRRCRWLGGRARLGRGETDLGGQGGGERQRDAAGVAEPTRVADVGRHRAGRVDHHGEGGDVGRHEGVVHAGQEVGLEPAPVGLMGAARSW